jgi:hypothetical protein
VTDKLAVRDPNVRAMTEIQLPCCETPALVDSLDGPIHCDGCGIDLDLADDAPIVAQLAA